MTDIDALISHLMSEHVSSCVSIGRDPGRYGSRWTNYIDVLKAERARVVELEAELQRHREYDLQSAKCIADLNRDVLRWADKAVAERALSDRLFEALNYVGDVADDDLNGGAVNYGPRLKAIEGFACAALTAHTQAREGKE